MENTEFIAKLKKLNTCPEAVTWVGDMDFKTAWEKCARADWMLWFICKMEIGTQRERIHVICGCAETALKYAPKGEDRPRLTIEAYRRYADNPTEENLQAARAAAWAAEAALREGAARATAWAVWATAWAAEVVAKAAKAAWAAEAAAWAAEAAAWAAEAAVRAAAGAAEGATRAAAHKQMCEMIRDKYTIDFVSINKPLLEGE